MAQQIYRTEDTLELWTATRDLDSPGARYTVRGETWTNEETPEFVTVRTFAVTIGKAIDSSALVVEIHLPEGVAIWAVEAARIRCAARREHRRLERGVETESDPYAGLGASSES
jgi:type IV secretory pathway TrbD component